MCVFTPPLFLFKSLQSLTNVAFKRNSPRYLVALFGEHFLLAVCGGLTGVGGGGGGGHHNRPDGRGRGKVNRTPRYKP